ncbi:root UVB sensitive family, partial [Protomyces lactucae-debilis]
LEEIFLPIDWRNTVSADYIPYQLYDSLQAIASSICGLLASREALITAGVSRSDASVDSAIMLNIASEACSRLLSIWFSWRYAAHFDAQSKRFRFMADIFNDSAMILSTLSSAVPGPFQTMVVIAASCLRALCGVCAGSTKAALTNHFAKSEASVGDVNSKDGSQETIIYLIGLALGSLLVPLVQSVTAIWTLLLVLIAVHLYMNWLACRSVQLRNLNAQRLDILKATFKLDGRLLTPSEVAQQEAVLGV